jgi:septation ring formation regulator EzrA
MVETEISSLEARMTHLENQLSEASADANILRINELADEYEKVKATLESLYEEWQEVAG